MWDKIDWQFEEDLLVVRLPSRSVEVRALRGLNMAAGTISCRIKLPVIGDAEGVQAGVVFRLGERGVPDGPAGHYIALWPGSASLTWTAVAQWERNLVIGDDVLGAAERRPRYISPTSKSTTLYPLPR